jgi:hypothetical protein
MPRRSVGSLKPIVAGALGILCSVIGMYAAPPPAAAQRTQPTIVPRTANEAVFRDYLQRNLAGKVKGYAFVLANRGGIVAKASGGWAQAPGDGRLAMKTFIPSNAGSVVKVASAVAFLDLLEANKAPGQSLEQALDTPIRFYVPDRWVRAYFTRGPDDSAAYVPANNRITLRDILNHRSGLKEFPDGGAHGTKVARALADGPNPNLIGAGDIAYLNENISLLLYMIPRIAYPQAVDSLELAHADKPLRDYNRAVARSYGVLYERYMRDVFFKRVSPAISPSCRPGEDYANNRYAKEYTSVNDGRGDTDYAEFCRSQGGWLFTAQELAHLARTIEFTDRLVDAQTRSLFYDARLPRERIVYPSFASNSSILARDPGGRGPYRAHGGTSKLGARAGLVRLPFGFVGVGLVNSADYDSAEVMRFVVDAFAAATRINPEWNTDRPGQNLSSVLLVEDPGLCQARCDANSACKAWTFVKPGIQHPIRGRCWLKSAVPAARSSGCCTSGVKGVAYGVDRPGSDYLKHTPARDDVALCKASCDADTQCKAWTYVKPGFQGTRSQCYLKNRTPGARRAACCASGVSR